MKPSPASAFWPNSEQGWPAVGVPELCAPVLDAAVVLLVVALGDVSRDVRDGTALEAATTVNVVTTAGRWAWVFFGDGVDRAPEVRPGLEVVGSVITELVGTGLAGPGPADWASSDDPGGSSELGSGSGADADMDAAVDAAAGGVADCVRASLPRAITAPIITPNVTLRAAAVRVMPAARRTVPSLPLPDLVSEL